VFRKQDHPELSAVIGDSPPSSLKKPTVFFDDEKSSVPGYGIGFLDKPYALDTSSKPKRVFNILPVSLPGDPI